MTKADFPSFFLGSFKARHTDGRGMAQREGRVQNCKASDPMRRQMQRSRRHTAEIKSVRSKKEESGKEERKAGK